MMSSYATKISSLVFFSSLFFCCWSAFIKEDVFHPTNGTGEPQFGSSVALSSSGIRALVGASRDDTAGANAGAVYVFDRNPSNASDWALQTVLYPSNGAGQPLFGISVAISSDGTRAIVGAHRDDTVGDEAGAAYVFDVNQSNPSNWDEKAILFPSNGTDNFPQFGYSVALSSNGTRALVSAPFDVFTGNLAGSAYVFDAQLGNSSDWIERTILYPTNPMGQTDFGFSVALSSDGTRVLIGSRTDNATGTSAGAAYVFDVNTSDSNDWMLQTILLPSNAIASQFFGVSVALSSDGTRAIVGAEGDESMGTGVGASFVFDVNVNDPSDWTNQAILYPSGDGQPELGGSVAITSDGMRAIVGARNGNTAGANAGSTYVYGVNPSNASDWMELALLYPSNGTGQTQFGFSVAISSDGTYALVGADHDDTEGNDAGAAYVFNACPGGTVINANGTACEPCSNGRLPNAQQTACVTIIKDQPITINENEPLIIDGDLNIQSNASITLSLNGPTDGSPFIVVSGCATFGGTLTINVSSIFDDDEEESIDLTIATYNSGLCPNFNAFDQIVIEGSKCNVVVDETYGETSLDVLITKSSGGGCSEKGDDDSLLIILASTAGASLLLCCALIVVLVLVVCLCGTSTCVGVMGIPLLRFKEKIQRSELHIISEESLDQLEQL